MSQVRENSKCGGDEHVSSSSPTSTTTANQESVVRDLEISIRIPPAEEQHHDLNDLRVGSRDGHHLDEGYCRGDSGGQNVDPKMGIEPDLPDGAQSSGQKNERTLTGQSNDSKMDRCLGQSSDQKYDRNLRARSIDPKLGQSSNAKIERNLRAKSCEMNRSDEAVDLDTDPNNDDSDPPVENYIFQEEEFQFEDDDDDDDEEFLPAETHHNLLTAQEQRQLLRKRAQAGHYRKRKKSTSDSNYIPPYAKKRFRRQTSVLPSKFLLGGNIRDPLNLASLSDAKVNAALNAETPKSSPLPVPMYRHGEVPVFIPKNPDDPLGLQSNEANTPYDFIAGIRKNTKGRKHRHRKNKGCRKRTDSECSVDINEDSDGKEGNKDTSISSEEEANVKVPEQKEKAQLPGSSSKAGVDKAEKIKTDEVIVPGPSNSSKPQSSSSGTNSVKQGPCSSSSASAVLNPPVPTTLNRTTVVEEEQKEGNSKSQPPASNSAVAVTEASAEGNGTVESQKETTHSKSSDETLNSAPKRKPRQRKRPRRSHFRQGHYIPNFYLSGPSSDYVPLGTPSVHEAALYQFSPGGPEYYDQSPFQSPSISTFNNQEPPCMEPFSPPPKPEVKRRRIAIEITPAPEPPAPVVPPLEKKEDAKFLKPPPPKLHFRNNNGRKRFRHKSDPIVSPVVPQPGCRRRFNHFNMPGSGWGKRTEVEDQEQIQSQEVTGVRYRKKDEVFQYGNYNRYYGYRITEEGIDFRLNAFPKEIFANTDVLDVGCNIGHVTMLIARDYGAKRVQGIDIDPKLIEVAKKNVKHYVDRDPSDETIRFPHSCPLMYGVLQPPPGTLGDTRKIPFPYNVSFRQENYVLESDDMLETVTPEYDLVLCLSISKWIHLNNGDDGLKRFFRRTFLHLRPGGKLILEPQPWSSYKRKKKLTEQIFANFKAIRFYPDKFQDYLLKDVGFSSMEKLTTPTHTSKGFQRPLMVFTKPEADSTPRRSPTHPQLGLVEIQTTNNFVPAVSPASTTPTPDPESHK